MGLALLIVFEDFFMARKPRVRARSGVYHVLMQGVRHRDIYIDDEDYRTFVEILERLQKSKDGEERYFTVYAYCLLPDHFHLLLKEETDTVSVTMGRIAAAYAHYFNDKYDRDGAIYRARFASEPVENEERWNTVLRYVSQSPERMKVWDAEHYPYSSWHEYAGEESELPRICEVPAGYQQLSKEEMVRLLSAPVPRQAACLGPRTEEMRRPKDDQVLAILYDMTKTASMMEFLGLTRAEQLKTLADLRKKGASIRQLEKLTGIGRGVIQNL